MPCSQWPERFCRELLLSNQSLSVYKAQMSSSNFFPLNVSKFIKNTTIKSIHCIVPMCFIILWKISETPWDLQAACTLVPFLLLCSVARHTILSDHSGHQTKFFSQKNAKNLAFWSVAICFNLLSDWTPAKTATGHRKEYHPSYLEYSSGRATWEVFP